MIRRALAMFAAAALGAVLAVTGPTAPAHAAETRLGGADRYDTSAMISQADPSPASVVFLASGRIFSDALSAAPVAAAEGGRLLLTEPGGIPDSIVREIDRLQPQEIVIVGGPATLSDEVESQAAALAPKVTRIAGVDRVDVSLALLDRQRRTSPPEHLWVVSGSGFADALSAASVAARYGHGLVLTLGADPGFERALRERLTGVTHLSIAGGPNSVGADVENMLRSTSLEVERIGGADRYQVSVAINQRHTMTTTAGRLLVASGEIFTDGLSGAVLAGALGAPMYLTPGACAPNGDVAAEARRLSATNTIVLGGVNTVSPAAAALVPCSALHAATGELLQRINQERAAAALPPLASDPCLARMAGGWASAMADGNLSGSAHNPYLGAEARACSLRSWGENVGRTWGAEPDPARIMSAWMASDGHRANILRTGFTHIGIGIDRGSNGYWYYVLDFGSR